jgi:3-hydroxymyristoyl/3-hydroxydecanoyl-(acyl carrier protein) dehydratase
MSTPARTNSVEFSIPGTHPSLAGHFPGRPIVPGVVLLDHVIAAAGRWLGTPLAVRSMPQAKFNAVLLPGERAHLELSLESSSRGATLRFTIKRDAEPIAQIIAQGSFGITERGA